MHNEFKAIVASGKNFELYWAKRVGHSLEVRSRSLAYSEPLVLILCARSNLGITDRLDVLLKFLLESLESCREELLPHSFSFQNVENAHETTTVVSPRFKGTGASAIVASATKNADDREEGEYVVKFFKTGFSYAFEREIEIYQHPVFRNREFRLEGVLDIPGSLKRASIVPYCYHWESLLSWAHLASTCSNVEPCFSCFPTL